MDVMTFYRGQTIIGNPCPTGVFLSYVYINKSHRATEMTIKGLASINILRSIKKKIAGIIAQRMGGPTIPERT